MIHHGNSGQKKNYTYFSPVKLEIHICSYSKYEHIFRDKKSNTTLVQRRENWRGRKMLLGQANITGENWIVLKLKFIFMSDILIMSSAND